mmetsp:Transcript_48031/g.102942  ORF Transcript_48031/g.102942 Transcript_48031/m.102942 type:complete len:672 (-) Transcript_48031:218-2233(-)
MIDYDEDWLIALIFRLEGSLALRASLYAIPSATLAVLLVCLDDWIPNFREDQGFLDLKVSQVWTAATACLMLLLGFRTSTAMARFWEGTSLLHQMRGEWFDAVSCCVTFSRPPSGVPTEEIKRFRHTLVRLMSLCHGSALEEIKGNDESDFIETIDVAGLDIRTLKLLHECKELYDFNRVELLLHFCQSTITKAYEDEILKVAAPIISRVYQTLSRGFVNLLNAKKICDTKFPFPYAQLIAFLLLLQTLLTPLMVSSIFSSGVFTFVFAFLPVFGFYSISFIAAELENPFGNDDNDLPLQHFQSEMNSCLLMLLHHQADHVPNVGPACIMDFDDLVSPMSECESDDFGMMHSTRSKQRRSIMRGSGSRASQQDHTSVILAASNWPSSAPPPGAKGDSESEVGGVSHQSGVFRSSIKAIVSESEGRFKESSRSANSPTRAASIFGHRVFEDNLNMSSESEPPPLAAELGDKDLEKREKNLHKPTSPSTDETLQRVTSGISSSFRPFRANSQMGASSSTQKKERVKTSIAMAARMASERGDSSNAGSRSPSKGLAEMDSEASPMRTKPTWGGWSCGQVVEKGASRPPPRAPPKVDDSERRAVEKAVSPAQLAEIMQDWSAKVEDQIKELGRNADAVQQLRTVLPPLLDSTVNSVVDRLVQRVNLSFSPASADV